jgi:uncharacterized membrane protein
MRTYTHGVIGYLLYAKRSRQERHLAVMGSMLPDVLLVIGFVPHYMEHVTQSSMVAELHRLLHHSDVHLITVGMHSFVIVSPCLALASSLYKPAVPFFVGMLAHGIVDFLTHRQWAYNHFFPLPLAPIGATVSYTDVGFTIVEHALLLLFGIWWMMQRKKRRQSN